MEAYLEWEIRDPRGRVIDKGRKRAESFVKGFIGLLRIQMSQASTTVQNTGGGNIAQAPHSYNLSVMAGVGDAAFGVVVGTGTNPVAIANYALQTLIAHGVGGGQLSYAAVSVTDYTVNVSNAYFTVSRVFTNNSGGLITVKEVGLYGRLGSSYAACMDRSLLTKAIAAGASATFTYTVKATV